MKEKIPYYMAYPIQLPFDDDRVERMDLEYLKSMYPEIPRRILPYVEEECDRMEYENSMIYDQYPDKLQLKLMCRRIFDRIKQSGSFPGRSEMNGMQIRWGNAGAGSAGEEENRMLRDLVEVMLFQELHRRRCDHRRKCRKFY